MSAIHFPNPELAPVERRTANIEAATTVEEMLALQDRLSWMIGNAGIFGTVTENNRAMKYANTLLRAGLIDIVAMRELITQDEARVVARGR